METPFKIVVALAFIVLCAVMIGVFLLILKIILLFLPEITLMGMTCR